MTIDNWISQYIKAEKQYPDKGIIIQEGNEDTAVYVLLIGQVKVKKRTAKGLVTLETLQKGAILGEMLLIEPSLTLRTTSVVADGPVKVGILDNDRILAEYEKLSPAGKAFLRFLFISLRLANDQVTNLVQKAD